MFDKLPAVGQGLTCKFPRGNEPFQIMTRLLEECGELAQEVNRWEGSGIKREKYGEPDRVPLAEEASHVLRSVMQLVQYYGLEDEVAAALAGTYERLKHDGFIAEDIV
jgi:NTP pyrophosphatase (non-canonical NTP hydrolase)